MLCQTWTWLAATTPLVAKPTLLSANRDHSSHERTYSYCCRQRSLLLRPYLLFLLPEETIPRAAAPLLVAAGRDYSSCHPHANEVGSEMSGGGSKAGGGGRAKPFCITRSSRCYTALLLGSCWVVMLASRSGGPTSLHPTPWSFSKFITENPLSDSHCP